MKYREAYTGTQQRNQSDVVDVNRNGLGFTDHQTTIREEPRDDLGFILHKSTSLFDKPEKSTPLGLVS
jgi:hypothetical protein